MNVHRLRLASTWVFAVNLLVLALSGFWLMWFYRPTESLAWADITTLHTSVTVGLLVRNLHHGSGILMYLTATLCFVANAVHSSPGEAVIRKWLRAGVCLSVFVTLFGATVSRVYFPGSILSTNVLRRWYAQHVGPPLTGLALISIVALIAIGSKWSVQRRADPPVR
jgi:quinol-cytochrome oxidoreductase complex cytochrome b subunit